MYVRRRLMSVRLGAVLLARLQIVIPTILIA